jgi:hypothetical protein
MTELEPIGAEIIARLPIETREVVLAYLPELERLPLEDRAVAVACLMAE